MIDCLLSFYLTETVPEYRKLRRQHKSSLDIAEYQSPEKISRFHALVHELQMASTLANPTLFHIFLNTLAVEGRLLRHYTQNVDCIEQRLPQLSMRSIQLHDRIDQVRCYQCGWCGPSAEGQLSRSDLPECIQCLGYADERQRLGKRRTRVGTLRPNVVLHGEECHNGDEIGKIASHDLKTPPDIVLVVGTKLQVPGAKRLTRELCRATMQKGGTTMWLNKVGPPSSFKHLFDFIILEDCEAFASSCLAA